MPVIEPFIPRELGPKPWGRELLVAQTDAYIAKVMWMRAGYGGPLQHHVQKDETFYLLSGYGEVRYRDAQDVLQSAVMRPGEAYHIPPGAVHQFSALTDCVLVEGSTPVFDDRVAEPTGHCARCGATAVLLASHSCGCVECQGKRPELSKILGQEDDAQQFEQSKANAG